MPKMWIGVRRTVEFGERKDGFCMGNGVVFADRIVLFHSMHDWQVQRYVGFLCEMWT
jgi:hypothetical protein